jgi:hypothetical protein
MSGTEEEFDEMAEKAYRNRYKVQEKRNVSPVPGVSLLNHSDSQEKVPMDPHARFLYKQQKLNAEHNSRQNNYRRHNSMEEVSPPVNVRKVKVIKKASINLPTINKSGSMQQIENQGQIFTKPNPRKNQEILMGSGNIKPGHSQSI